MKDKILAFLQERDDYVSGQDICQKLSVSRTAVWKYINTLRQEGYEIDSATRRGYRLVKSPDRLSAEALLACLPEGVITGEIKYYDSIDSTNEEAKRQAAAGAPDYSLYFSDNQTAGKGRRGRNWESPKGEDVFFSLLLRPDLPTDRASMVTLVAAAAVRAAVHQISGESCFIKWPNDIVMNGKKVCGILTEMSVEMTEIDYVVIGIGVNLNRSSFPEILKENATSIFLETGQPVERSRFLAIALKEFRQRYEHFLECKDLSFMQEEYNQWLINTGRHVKLIHDSEELVRTALGINERGELIVEDENHKRETVFSGEVSVRGLYGYV